MSNPYDQFDAPTTPSANPYDQFDEGAPPPKGPTAGDYVKSLTAGAASGLGMIAQGGGELVSRGINAVSGTDLRAINPLQGAIDWLNESQSAGAKQAVADTQISGDLTKPETWNFGKDPSVRGLALQGFNAIGQFAPNLAIAIGTAGASIPAQVAIGATVGGLQGLGGGVDEERNTFMAMSPAELTAKSALYREFIAKGVSPEVAKNAVAEAGALGGGLGNAIPSAAENAFENFLIGAITKGRFKIPSLGAGLAGKVAGGALGGGLMGGSEEAIEQATQNIGSNIAVGGDRPIGEGTLQQFVMGMIAEGTAGAAGGAHQHVFHPTVAAPAPVQTADPVTHVLNATSIDEALAAATRALDLETTPEDSAAFNQSMVPSGLLSEPPIPEAPPFQYDAAAQGQQQPDTGDLARPAAPLESPPIALPGEPAPPAQVVAPVRDTRAQYTEALLKSQRGELLSSYERTLLDNPPETPAIAVEPASKPRAAHPFDETQGTVYAPTVEAQNVADGQTEVAQGADVPTGADRGVARVGADVAHSGQSENVTGDGLVPPVGATQSADARREVASVPGPHGLAHNGQAAPASEVAPQFKDYTAPKADKAKGILKGSIRTFKTERGATLFAKSNKLTGYKARESEGAWILSKPVLLRSEAQRANDAALSAERTSVRAHDSLATVMGKMGGLRLADITSDGFDPEDAKLIRSGVFGKPALRAKGGISLDAMAELAAQHGFDVLDEDGRPDATKMRDLIDTMLEGRDVYTAEGHEYHATHQAQQRDEQARAAALPDDAALEESRYNDLSEPEQAAVHSIFDEDLTDALFDGVGAKTYESAEDAFPSNESAASEANPRPPVPREPEARGGGGEAAPAAPVPAGLKAGSPPQGASNPAQTAPSSEGVSVSGDANERRVAAADAISAGETVSPETLKEFPALAELAKSKGVLAAAKAEKAEAREAEPTIANVPPGMLAKIRVPVEQHHEGEGVKTVEVPASEALADSDAEISAYERLLLCVKAS